MFGAECNVSWVFLKVTGDMEALDNAMRMEPLGQGSAKRKDDKEATQQLRKRKQLFGRK